MGRSPSSRSMPDPPSTRAAVSLLALAAGLERAHMAVCVGGEGDDIPRLLVVAEAELGAASGYWQAGAPEADAWQACRDSVDRVAREHGSPRRVQRWKDEAGVVAEGVSRRPRARNPGNFGRTLAKASLRMDGGAVGHCQCGDSAAPAIVLSPFFFQLSSLSSHPHCCRRHCRRHRSW